MQNSAAYPETVKPDPCGHILHSMSSRADLSSRMQSRLLHSGTIGAAGAACHGFLLYQSAPPCTVLPYSDFSLTEQGRSKQKTAGATCPGLLSARSAILKKSNCTKYVFVELHKTKKTAYLLAFCKHAVFPTNFSNRFLPESCDLYGL